ncbi:hypothetical protein, partial [Aeromonas allosaccharophila]|uniref:hypothetical protein n=1 Tax=Aeromonas allosaccharophila TaxID=656 RepID=UPI001959B660
GFSRLSTRLFALPLALSMGRIIEIQLTLARLYRNKIAKKCNLLVIHINTQPLYRLIHRQGQDEDILHRINALQGYRHSSTIAAPSRLTHSTYGCFYIKRHI